MDPGQSLNTQSDTVADKPKVLIVDDDKFLLDMYTIKFRGEGFDVVSVGGGSEALEALRVGGDTFHAALLDLVMPAMDGFEVLRHAREENLAPSCHYIVLSNLGEPSDVERAKQFRISGYIIKASSTPSEVVEKVRKIINSL